MSLFQVENINITFGKGENKTTAIKNVTLSIEQGETVAIVGKSGSGKSTLLNALSGIEKLTSGKILYDNNDFSGLSEGQRAKIRLSQFGFVYQAFYLISSMNVYDNICLSVAANRGRADSEFVDHVLKELELDTKRKKLPTQLSGGEKQRVAIARAIVNKPRVVFADEPTGNLDSINGEKVFQLLFQFAKEYEQTLIYVTHDMEKAQLADRVITLKDGVIISDQKKSS